MAEPKDTLVAENMKSRCFLWSSFRDESLEKLYQSYSVKQKRAGLECFLITAILFDIYMLVVPSGQDFVIFAVMSGFLACNCCLLIWCKRGVRKCPLWAAIPHISWHMANAQLLVSLFLKKNDVTSRDNLGWVLLLDYLIYVTLPLRLRYCTILSFGTCASYLAAIIGLSKSDTHVFQQVTKNYLNQTKKNGLTIKKHQEMNTV